MCDQLVVIYECFTYANIMYVSVQSETGHCCIRSFLQAKTLFKLGFLRLIYIMRASTGLKSRMSLEFNYYDNLEVSYMFRKVSTSI